MTMPPNFEMIKSFIEEVGSYIPTLINGLESLKKETEQREALEESHRLVHTIKGAASLVGLNGLCHIASQMEAYLEDIIAGKQEFNDEAFHTMQRTVEMFREYCFGYMNGGVASRAMLEETVFNFRRIRGLSMREDEPALYKLLASVPLSEGLSAVKDIETEKRPDPASEPINQLPAVSDVKAESIPTSGSVLFQDGYSSDGQGRIETTHLQDKDSGEIPPQLMESFYEEAEEHLEELGRSLDVLDDQVKKAVPISPTLREESRRIRRSVHTLKGAAAVIGFQDFATYAHSLEDLLDWLFEEAREISPEIVMLLAESSDLLERIITKPQLLYSAKARSLKNQYKKIMGQNRSEKETAIAESQSEAEQETITKLNKILQAEKFAQEDSQTDLFEELSQGDDLPEFSARFTKTLRVDTGRIDSTSGPHEPHETG